MLIQCNLSFLSLSPSSVGPVETFPREMVSRRKILSRSRDDLNLDQAYLQQQQEEEEDVWYNKDKLFKVSVFRSRCSRRDKEQLSIYSSPIFDSSSPMNLLWAFATVVRSEVFPYSNWQDNINIIITSTTASYIWGQWTKWCCVVSSHGTRWSSWGEDQQLKEEEMNIKVTCGNEKKPTTTIVTCLSDE